MAKSKLMVVLGIHVLLSNMSFGMYNTKVGRFMQRDPIGAAPHVVYTVKGPTIAGTHGLTSQNPVSVDRQTLIIGVNKKSVNQQLKQNLRIQYIDSMNMYQYVISNPMAYLDPLGLLKIDRESCIKCRWAGDKPYREKFRKMLSSMQQSCDSGTVSKSITDPTLAACISTLCNGENVTCTMGKCGYGGSVDWKGKVEICPDEFDTRGIYKSKRTGEAFTAGALIIHEFAHKCGWFHGKGSGVPDPGNNVPWPY